MTRRAILFSVLFLLANIAVAAEQGGVSESGRKALNELQNKCTESCKNYIFGYSTVTGYECHYNVKRNKCYIVIYSISPNMGQMWRYLYDIGDSKGYDAVSSTDLTTCNIYIINHDTKGLSNCYSEIFKNYHEDIMEFNKRIKPYMTE
jgi:hypothetical protein